MTDKDLLVLEVQDDDTLADWYVILNGYEWPENLPDAMDGEKERREEYIPNNRRSQIIKWICNKVGVRKVSWHWNKERMTEDEFDLFWRGTHEGDEEALKKHREISWAKVGGEGPPPEYNSP